MNKNKNPKDKKKVKSKSRIRKFFKVLLLIILIIIIGYGIYFGYNYFRHASAKKEGVEYDPLSATALGIDPEKLKTVGRINILVLGESGYEDDYKLTDSIMVVSYNPQTQQASMLSVPRDTYVGKRDRNSADANYLASYKVNSVYRNGTKIPDAIERIEEVIGIDIDNYVLIDTAAIIQIVDAIGGVTFNVPIDMNYDDTNQNLHIHLKAGEQLIDGNKAEQLLRFRHNQDGTSYPEEYGDNDLGRMRTQREFIQTTLKQLIKFENATKVINLLNIVFDNIKTDLTLETIKYYIPYAFKFNMENIKTGMVPGTNEKCNGIWLYVANKKETKQLVEELFVDIEITTENNKTDTTNATIEGDTTTLPDNTNKTIKVEILKGCSSNSKFESAKEKLKDAGYIISKSGTTTVTQNSLIIERTMQSETIEKQIKETMDINRLNKSLNNSNVDFTIIIGNDYE